MFGTVVGLISTVVISAIALYFLLMRRYAFERSGNAQAPPRQATLASG